MTRGSKDSRCLVVLQDAIREGKCILNRYQYAHVASVLKRLVRFGDRDEMSDLEIKAVDECFEIKLTGGMLCSLDLRVYFAIGRDCEIVVLKTYKAEEGRSVGRHVVINAEDRMDQYTATGCSAGSIVYRG